MKAFLSTLSLIASLLLTPASLPAQPGATSRSPPPVAQALVPEGYFAARLAAALQLQPVSGEAQAESALAALGIAPTNGWIDRYPVTPEVVGELRRAVRAAAASGKLAVGADAAVAAFDGLVTEEMGAAVATDASSRYGPGPAPEPPGAGAVDDYYRTEGPPAVTYYPPPPDYQYLYGWVAYPFWSNGLFFSGFFVLSDFDVIVVRDRDHDRDDRRRHERLEVTNHVVDPKTHDVSVLGADRREHRRASTFSSGASAPKAEGWRWGGGGSERGEVRARGGSTPAGGGRERGFGVHSFGGRGFGSGGVCRGRC